MKVLVTGGAGFIGSHLCNALLARGWSATAVDDLSLGWRAHLDPGVSFKRADVTSPDALAAVGTEFDAVVHLAAASSSPMFDADLVGCYANNLLGFLQVLEHARRSGIRRVLYASSATVYGGRRDPLSEELTPRPPNHYGVTKRAMEDAAGICARRWEMDLVGFRFMSVYGTNEGHKGRFANVASQFLDGMASGRAPVLFGDGRQSRDFVHVDDVVRAILLALTSERVAGSALYNVGRGEGVTLLDLVETINQLLGTQLAPSFAPKPVPAEYIDHQQADLSRVRADLGFEPRVALERGLRLVAEERGFLGR
jgi:UDP-glucose 4-epimerase